MIRRDFLKIGGLGLGGLSFAQLLQAEAQAGVKNSKKAVIMIYLVGGPPHQDLFDLKPDAPAEIAGPHKPISTNVSGIEICELLPQFGSIVGKLQGQANRGVPPFVSLAYTTTHGPYNEPGPGYLGVGASPLAAFDSNRENMVLQGITPKRLADRRSLLASMDQLRRDLDASGKMEGIDAFNAQAMDVLTSSRLADALDLSKEDPRLVARYGTGDTTKMMDGNGAPRVPQSLLMARRLVEAGCRVVTLNYSKWDWHGGKNAEGRPDNNIFGRDAEDFPVFDNCVSALVDDLHERGMDKDVTVIAWGEFGRTPIISKNVGRDHWPRVSCALMAGGGMRTGQVIGATDRLGGEATARPVRFGEVFATLYHNLGIDVKTAQLTDLQGRPQYLLDGQVDPIRELI